MEVEAEDGQTPFGRWLYTEGTARRVQVPPVSSESSGCLSQIHRGERPGIAGRGNAPKREGRERYAVLACEKPLLPTGAQGAIDLGTTSFCTASDGEFCDNHWFFRPAARRSDPRCGSFPASRTDAATVAGRPKSWWSRCARGQRLQLRHVEAKKLVTSHDLICHKRLNVKGLGQGNLSKQIHNEGWGQFFSAVPPLCAHRERGRECSENCLRAGPALRGPMYFTGRCVPREALTWGVVHFPVPSSVIPISVGFAPLPSLIRVTLWMVSSGLGLTHSRTGTFTSSPAPV
ncbi:hypothetical protein SAMN00790413_01797 [Deinococcus hopiensis KR-140]|uniref:Uncharacterized protein n=1 Tax=Deinococcus hopiensis KR-140 TaxID=695939 RepID=A0A1W1VI04_9DEIO|nr:hypothetical protein SAMN00790413_01797 [Deinococcus hopiensis KR-140]